METNEKRKQIIDALNRARGNTIDITFSSPPLKGFYILSPEDPLSEKDIKSPALETASSIFIAPEQTLPFSPEEALPVRASSPLKDSPQEDEELEEISYKEYKKKLKEEKLKAKRFEQARKDAKKRGYDTGILKHFEDPEEIYGLSNEEVDQIQAAGYINRDGYYDFFYPEDINEHKKRKLSKARVKAITGVLLFCGVLLVWLFINIGRTF